MYLSQNVTLTSSKSSKSCDSVYQTAAASLLDSVGSRNNTHRLTSQHITRLISTDSTGPQRRKVVTSVFFNVQAAVQHTQEGQ